MLSMMMMIVIIGLFSNSIQIIFAETNQSPTFLFDGRNCGQSSFSSEVDMGTYISGGWNVSNAEMPWLVRLSITYANAKSETCGGFILDEYWIITAAHCLESVVSVKVSVGRINYQWGSSNQSEQVQVVPITRLFPHPQYDSGTFLNDIGMVFLPYRLSFNQNVRPICILDEESCTDEPHGNSTNVDYCATNVISAGWGYDNLMNSPTTNQLKAANLTIIPHEQCQMMHKDISIFQEQICARGLNLGDDTCSGDSGGPLFCYRNNSALAIAVVSFGPRNCGTRYPAMYNRVCVHVGWMKSVVRNATSPQPLIGCQVPRRRYGNSLVNVANGSKISMGDLLAAGTVVRIFCRSGFEEVIPGRQSVCSSMGTWIPSIGYCRRITATTSTTTTTTTTSTTTSTTTTTTTITTTTTTTPAITTTTTTTALPQCHDPISIGNAQISNGGNDIGSYRLVICNDGYQVSLSIINYFFIQCLSNLQWSTPKDCERICFNPPQVPNGNIGPGNYTQGSQRPVYCQEGYELNGPDSITCLASGNWSAPGVCVEGKKQSFELSDFFIIIIFRFRNLLCFIFQDNCQRRNNKLR